ncbi:MAG TPA: hypothetical protein VJL83_04795 [Patescibacteria group bacterium]|nr:hypothetical protein [Patescibacteria group bacterium]
MSAVVMIVIMSLLVVSISYAQSDTSVSTTETDSDETVNQRALKTELRETQGERRDEVRELVQERRNEVTQMVGERKADLQERLANRLQMTRERRFTFAYNRISSLVARIKKLAERVQSRIDKEEGKGTDVTETDQYMDTADEAIANAESVLMHLKELFDALPAAEGPTAIADEIRTAIQDIKEYLQTAHEALRNAIAALKEARMPEAANNPVL